jgi:hypothetical protein
MREGLSTLLRSTQEEIQNEMELDMWRSVRNRTQHPRPGSDFGVYRTSTPAGPLRTSCAASWSGLRLGQWLLVAARGSLSVGARALGPSTLSRGALGESPLSSPAARLAVTRRPLGPRQSRTAPRPLARTDPNRLKGSQAAPQVRGRFSCGQNC